MALRAQFSLAKITADITSLGESVGPLILRLRATTGQVTRAHFTATIMNR